MKSLPLSFKIQLFSGFYILLCIPLIFLAEKFRLTEAPFHITQFFAVFICFISGVIVQLKARKYVKKEDLLISGLGVLLTGFYLMLVGYLLFGSTIADLVHRRKFDAAVWRESSDVRSKRPPRLCMVDNLIKSKRLDGLTQPEVIELLGEPEGRDPVDGATFPGGAYDCDIHYYLGPERGFISIDSEWLFITFDKDGKVNRYWLYTD